MLIELYQDNGDGLYMTDGKRVIILRRPERGQFAVDAMCWKWWSTDHEDVGKRELEQTVLAATYEAEGYDRHIIETHRMGAEAKRYVTGGRG